MIWILSVGLLFYGKQLSKFFYICFLLEKLSRKYFSVKKKIYLVFIKIFFFILNGKHFFKIVENSKISYYLIIILNLFFKFSFAIYFILNFFFQLHPLKFDIFNLYFFLLLFDFLLLIF